MQEYLSTYSQEKICRSVYSTINYFNITSMRLCSDGKPTYVDDRKDISFQPVHPKLKGLRLRTSQLGVLMKRQWHYVKIRSFIILVVALGALICFMSYAYNNPRDNEQSSDRRALNLDMFAETPQGRALVNMNESALAELRAGFGNVTFIEVPDVTNALRTRRTTVKKFKKYRMGIEINDTVATVLYSPSEPHTALVSLNTLSNALAILLLTNGSNPLRTGDARMLTVRNIPLQGAFVPFDEANLKLPKSESMIRPWVLYMTIIICFYISSFSRLPCLERLSGTRSAYIRAGAPRYMHWMALMVGHGLQVMLILLLVVLFAGVMDKDSTFTQPGFLCALFILLVVGGLANLMMVYFFSTFLGHKATNTTAGIIIMVCTFVCLSIPKSEEILYMLIYIPYGLFPPCALAMGILEAGLVAHVNAYCNLNRENCPTLVGPGIFRAEKCCDSPSGSEPWRYFEIGNAGLPLIILAVQCFVYCGLTYLFDDGALDRLMAKKVGINPIVLRFDEPAVKAEGAYVEKTIKLANPKVIPDAILCNQVRKNFSGCCKKPCVAVKSISFSVKKGECFGLLGVNGAGKTTTFRILTGEIVPTRGEIYANGLLLGKKRSKYLPKFSYCPQFGGVDDFLTGRQNLKTVLTLRGLHERDARDVAASWIEEVDLTRFADKPVSSYSGGSARRLAAAAALCQSAPTSVLDEPTSGVDPVARRHMHQALMRARRRKQSIIISSHSLDEIETLCHRIAIMSGGELRSLGSAAELKARHAQGYTVVFKLTTTDANDYTVNKLKNVVHQRFNCELRDEHRSMLHYHVKGPLSYSELFIRLEQLQDEFPSLIDDYTVTETTLEEVFLALAKEAKEKPPSATAYC